MKPAGSLAKTSHRVLFSLVLAWVIFIITHTFLAGQLAFFNLTGSIPTIVFLIVPALLLLAILILRCKNILLIALSSLSLCIGCLNADIHGTPYQAIPHDPNTATNIRIFNWNTQFWDQNKNPQEFYRFLKLQNADVYILQEYLYELPETASTKPLELAKAKGSFAIFPNDKHFPNKYLEIDDRQLLQEQFPGYHIATMRQFVFISRYPITRQFLDSSEQFALATIDVLGTPLELYNVHMLLHVEPSSPFSSEFYTGLQSRFDARKIGFANLKRSLAQTKNTYLVSGDFNSTTAMGVMNYFLNNHVDCSRYSATVFPITFELHGLSFWRLDYTFIPKAPNRVGVLSFENISPRALSDHSGQLLQLSLTCQRGTMFAN